MGEIKNVLSYVEVVVTTLCTLRCKDCANMIPSYKHPYHLDYKIIVQSLDRLLAIFDKIEVIGILGGEPFLYPELKKLVDYLCQKEKIERIRIVTNGTVLIDEINLLQSFQSDKVWIQVNDYPEIQKRRTIEICKLLKARNINYLFVDRKKETWRNYGACIKKDKIGTELKKQFSSCEMKCRSLLNGKMYYCPRSAHGSDLGLINEKACVDLLDNSLSDEIIKENLLKLLYEGEYIEACKICNAGTNNFTKIRAAIQLE